MKKLSLVILSLWGGVLASQTIDDTELFNSINLHGTPRYVGMGGAFTALGNDFSALQLNPAGAAVFRKSQFNASLGIHDFRADQHGLFGYRSSNVNTEFNLENLGFVNKKSSSSSAGSGWAFAVTYNKLADFDRSYTLSGINAPGVSDSNTLGQYYLFFENYNNTSAGALGKHIDDISNDAYAAYQAGLLVDLNDDGIIDDYGYGLAGTNNNLVYNRQQFGSHNQVGLSLAGAHEGNVYYGAALNFPTLNYELNEHLRESGLPVDTFPYDVSGYSLNRYTAINAAGINLNFGVIIKPVPSVRIGASIQTPSWYWVDEVYETSINATYEDSESSSGQSEVFSTGTYSYRMTSPAIYRLGGAFIFPNKKGLISLDYEYRDVSGSTVSRVSNNLSIEQEFADDANFNIMSAMNGVNSFKAGLEYRLGPVMLRGGANYLSSMYNEPEIYSSGRTTFSGGIGYQNDNFGVDLALASSRFSRQDFVHPFLSYYEEDLVDNDFELTSFLLGFHLKF